MGVRPGEVAEGAGRAVTAVLTVPSTATAFVTVVFVAALSTTTADAASVQRVRVGEHPGKTRVVLDLSGPMEATVARSPDGMALSIDLPGAEWGTAAAREFKSAPLVAGYRETALPGGGVRLTINGKKPIALKELQKVGPGEGQGHRLVFDVTEGAATASASMGPVVMAPVTPVVLPEPTMDNPVGRGWVAPHVSTMGLGIDASYRVDKMLGLRLSGNYFRYDRDGDISGIDYSGKATLKSLGALADIYPLGISSGFHVTGGAYLNLNKGDLSSTPTSNTVIGDNTYTPSQIGTLSGKVDFNRFSPYLGIGWKGDLGVPDLVIGADLGVMYQGEPSVSLSASGLASSSQFQSDLERERKNIEDELSDFRFYPIATISVGYKF